MSIYYDWKAAASGGTARLEADDATIDKLISEHGDRYKRGPPHTTVVYDISDPKGACVATQMHSADAEDCLRRNPERYVRELPKGAKVARPAADRVMLA